MKVLIIYDSVYGNTEKISRVIGNVLNAKVVSVSQADVSHLSSKDLLIVGSPVHGGRATLGVEAFIRNIPKNALLGIKVATFDTRFSSEDHGLGLQIVMGIIRFAAEKMAKDLKRKGGDLIIDPEGFIVKDKMGPLENGEEIRAAEWAKLIKQAMGVV